MKKILAVFAVLFLAGAMATPAMADNEDAPGQNKVTICHVTPGQSVTLTIPEDQANGHLTGKAAGHDLNGPVEDYLGECKSTPTPSPTPTPTPTQTTPPAGPPAPPTDYCANLEGVQWEGYDCNTPQPVETTVVVPTVEPTPTPTVPPVVSIPVPEKPTVPKSVPAGEGSDSNPAGPFALLAMAGAAAIAAGLRLIKQ